MTTPAADGFRCPPSGPRTSAPGWPGRAPTPPSPATTSPSPAGPGPSVARDVAASSRSPWSSARGRRRGARALLGPGIDAVERELDDAWMRDIGPTFVTDDGGDWRRWTGCSTAGAPRTGPRWEHDPKIARHVADLAGATVHSSPLVNEGGGIHVDGEGTVLLTETVQLGPERNPGWTRERGRGRDPRPARHHQGDLAAARPDRATIRRTATAPCGHVDIVAAFARPGVVVAHTQPDPAHPDHERLPGEHGRSSRSQTDARGRRLEVVEVPAPTVVGGGRRAGSTTPTSTTTSATAAWSLCAFDDPRDEEAAGIFRRLFPEPDGDTGRRPDDLRRAAAASTASPSSSRRSDIRWGGRGPCDSLRPCP